MDAPEFVNLFVYGTLRPGQNLWPMIEPAVKGTPVCVLLKSHALLDSGFGYPYMVQSPLESDTVRGTLLEVDINSIAFNTVSAMELRAGYDLDVVETEGGAAITYVWPELDSTKVMPYRRIAGMRVFDFALYREYLGYPPNQSALLEK